MSLINLIISGSSIAIAVLGYNIGILLTAKFFKIKIEKFYIFDDFFNKRFSRFYVNDSEFGLGIFPLGGYVKLAGMGSEKVYAAHEGDQNFNSKTPLQQFIVTFSGILSLLFLFIISISLINIYNNLLVNLGIYLSFIIPFLKYFLNNISSETLLKELSLIVTTNSIPALMSSLLFNIFIILTLPLNILSIGKSSKKKIVFQNLLFVVTLPVYLYIILKIILLLINNFGLTESIIFLIVSVGSCYLCGFIFFYLVKVFYQTFNLKRKKFLKAYVRNHFDRGLEFEKQGRYEEACKSYLLNINKKTKDPVLLQTISQYRYYICQIKAGKIPRFSDIDKFISVPDFDSSPITYCVHDLMYRYIYVLINNYYFNEAASYIYIYLDDSKNEVKSLINYLNSFKRNKLIEVSTDINKYISNIVDLNAAEIKQLQNLISSNEEILIDNDAINTQIIETKEYLFNKFISKSISEDRFEECLKEIISINDFIEDPLLLKNVGNCCIRIAMSEKLNEDNYENVISLWLASIYSDKVMVKILELASWDDNYSFTFIDSIGSNFKFQIELENCNYEPINENNISIGSVQRSLLSEFENYLNKIKPDSFRDQLIDYYKNEKAILNRLVEVMSFNIVLTTPNVARKYNSTNKILKYLETIYEQKQDESILELGSKYIDLKVEKDGVKLQTSSEFEKYASSLWYEDLLLENIKNLKIENIKKETFKNVICRFDTIKDDFESKAINEVNYLLKNDEDSEQILELLKRLVEIVPDSNDLRYLYADNANYHVVNELNNDNITDLDALLKLCKAIFICPQHQSAAKNFSYVVKSNLVDDTFRDVVKSLIPKLKSIACKNLYNVFYNEFDPYMSELRAMINRPRIDISKLIACIKVSESLIKAVNIYKTEDIPF